MRKAISVIIVVLASSVFAAVPLKAHEFHTTFTTIEHNQAAKNLEITIKVFTHDLAPTMKKRLGKSLDLGGNEVVDKAVLAYVLEKLRIEKKSGEVLIPKWIGKEVDSQVAFFYLEIPFEGDLAGASVSNSMFFESFEEQINYVSVKYGEQKSDLVFKVGDKKKLITD